ncbi:MAG: 30S ribosomal protein S16 [Acidimicrobiales bacterium]|nr:30S ribosomal protein S16 [Acidimicrobiales bacterium]RIK08456.1 MAG: 30S ribosomal protein S16 [Acidobacteriota bacterium]
MGRKKQPTYRVVAADKRAPRDGRFIEIIGTYEPRRDPSVVEIDNERAVEWLRKGAQPSERVRKLLEISGAWDEFKGNPPGTSTPRPPAAEPSATPKAGAPPAVEKEAPPLDAAESSPGEALEADAAAAVTGVATEAGGDEGPAEGAGEVTSGQEGGES